MANYIATTSLGANNTGIGQGNIAASDIVVKDLELTVSNYVKDRTPVTNMALSKKIKAQSTTHIWSIDQYRTPGANAKGEGAGVSVNDIPNNTRGTLNNSTQIFTTTVGSTGTARAVVQAGGDPQEYQRVKQLTEIMFDVELQMIRADQFGTKYFGQSGTATGAAGGNTGRRFGSLAAFAGTVSSNPTTAGTSATTTSTNLNRVDPNADTLTTVANTVPDANGQAFFSGTETLQAFGPALYKQLVTVAEQRFNAKITNIVCPTSLRTTLSDQFPTSRSINRFNPADKGDVISTYEGDFNYTYQIDDNWVMDQGGGSANNIFFLNPEVIQWAWLRELGPNNEVFANADASLDQFIMEGALVVRNPAGVGLLRNVRAWASGDTSPNPRTTYFVQRYIA